MAEQKTVKQIFDGNTDQVDAVIGMLGSLGKLPTQTKTVTAGTSTVTVKGDDGNLLESVTINPTPTEEKTVTAGTSASSVTPTSGKHLSKVTVNPTPSQSKTVTPTANGMTVKPDSGKLLSSVILNPFALEGQYVWKKYLYEKITKSVSNPQIQLTSIGDGKRVSVTKVSGDFELSQLNDEFFDGFVVNSDIYFTYTNGVLNCVWGDPCPLHYDSNTYTFTFSNYVVPLDNIATYNGTKIFTSENKTFLDYAVSNDPTSYPNGGTQDGYWYEMYGTPTKIVTWAGGTDAEIVAMIEEARKGYINLADYWTVGDVRTISLSAMAATGVGETHAAQNVNIVISEFGGKTLEDGTECLLQYDFQNCLAEIGYMVSSNNNTGGYESSPRMTWCDNVCFAALPSWLQSVSRRFKTKTFNGGTTTTVNDGLHKLALRTEKEVLGTRAYSHANEANVNTQPSYYTVSVNRVKGLGIGGEVTAWWTGSAHNNVSQNWCYITTAGTGERAGCMQKYGIAPYGCI